MACFGKSPAERSSLSQVKGDAENPSSPWSIACALRTLTDRTADFTLKNYTRSQVADRYQLGEHHLIVFNNQLLSLTALQYHFDKFGLRVVQGYDIIKELRAQNESLWQCQERILKALANIADSIAQDQDHTSGLLDYLAEYSYTPILDRPRTSFNENLRQRRHRAL